MNTSRRHILLASFTACLLCFLPVAMAKKPGGGGGGSGISFRIVELPAPSGLDPTGRIIPNDVNDLNHVVGLVEVDQSVNHAIFWSVDGSGATPIDLGSDVTVNGLNESDELVGTRTGAVGELPVLWLSPSVGPIDLPLPAGHARAGALQMNDDGLIVGYSSELISDVDENGQPIVRQQTHAVAWQLFWINGQPEISAAKILGTLVADKNNWSEGVSAAEEVLGGVFAAKVVGSARNVDNNVRGVIWELISYVDNSGIQIEVVSGPTELGTLPGDNGSHGDAINKHGDVAGTPGFRKLYGQPIEPLLPPSSINDPGLSYINDINDAAEVVGVHYHGYGYSNPILWFADGLAVDLDKYVGGSGWASFQIPTAINNSQAIVGYGAKYQGKGKNSSLIDGAYILLPQ